MLIKPIMMLTAAAMVACTAFAEGQTPADTTKTHHQSVGLVLSGGGAKGVAHIGVIKALEENDIPIDYITGTSMGSIVGGLYAAGYTPDEMMQLLLSPEFAYWSTGRINPSEVYYFGRPVPTPAIITQQVGRRDTTVKPVPSSIINPLPMNFAFMQLFSAYTAQCGGDFDKLFVPFRCIASDVKANHKVVHRSGSLGDAIRTSMSFPIVFQPIEVNGQLLYDGGIYDNFPVDVMLGDFAPDFMIGVDVAASSTPQDNSTLLGQVENLVMRPQSYAMPGDRGIKMRINLDQFSLLDFQAAKKIYDIGYAGAMQMIDSIKGRVTSRTPAVARQTARAQFKSATPYVHFKDINVTGASPAQNRYIKYLFEPAHADTFGLAHARESFYRAISGDRLQDLFPQAAYNNSTGLFDLSLTATPKRNLSLGLGGYITSSTNSYLFLSAAYNTFSLRAVSTDINAWIGQSYMAGQISALIKLGTAIPSAFWFNAVTSRMRYFETDKMFFDDSTPSFLVAHQYYARLGFSIAAGPHAKVSLGAGYGHLRNSYYRPDILPSKEAQRDRTTRDLGQLRLTYEFNTLNDYNLPTDGQAYNVTLMGVTGKYRFHSGDGFFADTQRKPTWVQAEASAQKYFDMGTHFSLGLRGDALYTNRNLTGNYFADLVDAIPFTPTPALTNTFNGALRSNAFVSLGVTPVYKYKQGLSTRLTALGYMPMRNILPDAVKGDRYGRWFGTARFFGQIDINYNLPINLNVGAYVNYVSAGSRPWGVGLNLGLFILAPRYLR